MANDNRNHQLEDIANKSSQNEGKYDALAAGELSVSSSQNGTTHLVPVPVTLKAQVGSPVGPWKLPRLTITINTYLDSFSHRRFFYDTDNIGTLTNGVSRRYNHQRLHWQFLFRCRSVPKASADNSLIAHDCSQVLEW